MDHVRIPARWPLMWVIIASSSWLAFGAAPANNIFNIQKYGAHSNRDRESTKAIQKTIDACAGAGGGQVYVPPGEYLMGPIWLKSHVDLHLDAGATIWASSRKELYYQGGIIPDSHQTMRWPSEHPHFQLINGEDLENVTISGRGTLHGQGKTHWWGVERLRPVMIHLKNCRYVQLLDITLQESFSHASVLTQVRDLTVRGLSLFNDLQSPNTDGLHLEGCRNAHLSDLTMETGGDLLVLNDHTQDVIITNSILRTADGILRPQGAKNVTLANCTVTCQTLVKDIQQVEQLQVSQIIMHGSGPLFSSLSGPSRNLRFSHITALEIVHAGGLENAEGVTLDHIDMTRKLGQGLTVQAKGFLFREVRNLSLHHITLKNVEHGPALRCENTPALEVDSFLATGMGTDDPILYFQDVNDAYIHHCRVPNQTLFIQLTGSRTRHIHLGANDMRGAPLAATLEVPPDAVATIPVTFAQLKVPDSIDAHTAFPVHVQVTSQNLTAGLSAATLFIDNQPRGTTWLWLTPGETQTATLMAPPLYQPRAFAITVGSLPPVTRLPLPRVAEFEIHDLSLSTPLLRAGHAVDVQALVKNTGSYQREETVKLSVQGSDVAQKTLSLRPGACTPIDFFWESQESGLFQISIGEHPPLTLKAYDNPLASTLLHLDFEQITDHNAFDQSGLDHHAQLKANANGQPPRSVAGPTGMGIRFNGQNAYGEIPYLLFRFPMTLTLWIKPGALPAGNLADQQMIVYAGSPRANDGYGPEPETHLAYGAGNTLAFWSAPNVDLRYRLPEPKAYYFVAVVFDTTSRLFVNEKEIVSVPNVAPPDFTAYAPRTYLGRPTTNLRRYFNGTLDEVRIYSEALSADEIRELYQCQATR